MYTTILGVIGAGLVLWAFVMNEMTRWKATWLRYDVVNLVGSGLLVWYGMLIQGYPFVALNLIWAAVSLRDVVLDIKKKK